MLPRQDIRDIAQVVQAQLNSAGFRVELKNQELGSFIQDWRNSNFQAFASTNAGSPDPDDYFYRSFRTGGSTNVFKYTNLELDALLYAARHDRTFRAPSRFPVAPSRTSASPADSEGSAPKRLSVPRASPFRGS